MNVRGETASEMAECFEMTQQLRPRVNLVASHMMLSLSPNESLSDEVWTEIIDRYLDEMGFTNNFFIALKCNDKQREYVHIVAGRIRCDGTVVSDSWERVRSQKIIRQIEQDYNLTPVRNSWESDRQAPTISQIKQELKTGTPTVKKQLADRIDLALTKVINLSGLLEELERDGIEANQLEDTKAFDPSLIAKEIKERAKSTLTMPQLLEQLKQVGIEPYIKYTRTNKIKGITYSIGKESIQGHELGKEYSWIGLQKYLQVSYDAERDNPLIKAKQSYLE